MSKSRSQPLRISYGNEVIPVEVRYTDTRRFTVTVDPDLTVRANAPQTATEEEVTARLEKRAGWISRQRAYFERFRPERPAQRFVSGASLWYLGRQYRVRTIEGKGEAKLIGQFLQVPAADESASERKVGDWYREHAKLQFSHRLKLCHAASNVILKVEMPPLVVRKMVRRWGSCTATGRVILNTDLIRTPIHCIDYVIVHELCHVRVHGHDKAFYRLLSACLPDWEKRKARLESFVI
jgi:predicted metal-dependent hydrolase